MKFTPTWYKTDTPDIPSFQELENITGSAYTDDGIYVGPKEKPEMQLVMDQRTNRQYWAPKDYDEDSVKYGMAKLEKDFNSKEWWGMVYNPHLTMGEKVSTAYLEVLKQAGKLVVNAPTKFLGFVAGATDAVGLDAGAFVRAGIETNNPIFLASAVARKGIKATAKDYVQLFKDMKTPKGQMGTTATFWRATANNWQATVDKYFPDVDDNIKANSTLVAIGSMSGQIAGSLLVAAATNGVGGLPAVAAVFGGQQFYDIREEYLQKGYSLQSANIYAGLAALAEGGLEMVGFKNLLRFATLSKSFRNVAISGLVESLQEALQTSAEEAITNLSGVREETMAEIMANIAISAIAGFVPGAGFSLMVKGSNIAQEKAAYELDKAIEPVQASEAQETKKGPALKKELELAKANKGSNQLYETVKNIANAHGITDEKAIDGFYYAAKNRTLQGQLGEQLLEGLGKQIVAYKGQLLTMDKQADADNKEAAADINHALSQEAADKWHEQNAKAMEEIGIDRGQAEIAAKPLDNIYRVLSDVAGKDIQTIKPVQVRVVPTRQAAQKQEQEMKDYEGEIPFQDGKNDEAEINALQQQIDSLDKMSRSKPKTTLLSTLRKTGVDYKNSNLDPQVLKDLHIKNVPVSKGGLGAESREYLIKHGFMQGFAQGEQTSYEMLSEQQESANDMLQRAVSGEEVYRMDDMEQVARAEQAQGYKEQLQEELDQKLADQGKRGYIQMGELINEIVLNKNSDISTLQHEMVHHFKNVIYLLAAQGNKKAQALKAQIEKIIQAHKDEVKQGINTEEEVLTEAYEAWLYGGVVAENQEQQTIFDMMRKFFQDIYDSVKAITGIRIDPEIDMFFRQLTGQMDIQTQEVNKADSIYDRTDKSKNMTDNEVKAANEDYQAFKEQFARMQAGEMPSAASFTLSRSLPSAYNKIPELKGKRMVMSQSIFKKIIDLKNKHGKNHNLDYKRAEKLPLYVADPLYITRSKSEGHEDRFIIITGSRGVGDGVRLSVVVQPSRNVVVVSAYDEVVNISEEKKANRLVYNKKEELLKTNATSKAAPISNSTNSIANQTGIVKTQKMFQEGIKYDKNRKADINSPEFKKWFGNSKVVDENGKPLVVYHGSTKEFEVFDINKANVESDLGKGFYFTNNEDDVNANYHGGGPDFENKVDRIAERIQDEEGLEWEEAKAKAYKQEYQTDALYPVYLKMETPFVIGGEDETVLTFEEPYNEETDEYGELEGTLLDFAYNMDNYLADIGIDYKISQELFMRATDNGGEISASEIYDIISKDENLLSLLDYESSFGELLSNTVAQEYDGIIDHTVNKKFGSERSQGKKMVGMDTDTTHYIVFEPTQIKSVYNKGTFDEKNPNIYYQNREQAYRDDRAQRTGAQAADPKPTKERIASDLAIIKERGVEKYQKKSNLIGEVGDWAKDILLSVRQRAGKIDPKLKAFFDKLDYFQPNLERKFASKAKGFIKKYQSLTEDEKNELDYYIYNQCFEELQTFLKDKGMSQEYNEVRQLLNFIYAISNQAGIDMNFVHEYFPTSMIDYAGFLDYLKGTDKWSYIAKALREADPEGLWSDKEKAEAISKLLRGYRLDPVSKPKNAKERTILYKSPELMKFYEHSDVALVKYLQGMTQALAINKTFGKGKGFNTDETIGAIVLDLIESGAITHKEESEVKKLLKSRLSYGATPQLFSMIRNVGYLQTMNNITNAITQLGDLYAPFYKYSFGTAIKAIFGKSEITKADLGLDQIWEEFSNQGQKGVVKATGIAVEKLFKAIGLEKMDSFGKSVAINASWLNLKEQAAKGDMELTARLAYTFGKDAGKVLADIKAGNITDDVKILIWSDLADTQPIGRSGVPTGYLDNPRMRLFYQLKTFMLNQVSLFYADSLVNIQKGIKYHNKAQFLKGVQNGFKLVLLLTAGNAGADILKNLIMGRNIDVSDTVVSNLLWNLGVSKYTFYRGQRDGYARALLENYLMPPQISIGDDIYTDIRKIATGKRELKDTMAVTYLPFGRAYYWWFGGGRIAEIEKAKKEKKRKKK